MNPHRETPAVTYSRGQLQDQDTRPTITGPELWQVHYYETHPLHRVTWDISRGKVLDCYEQTWQRQPRRNYDAWTWTRNAAYPLPIAIDEELTR